MNKGLKSFLFFAATLILCSFFSSAQGEEATIDQQLKMIIENQKRMEQRLTVIENYQKAFTQNMVKSLSEAIGQRPQQPQPPQIDYDEVHDIEIGSSPIQGPKDAKVTIYEFSEIQCPYSKRFHPIVEEVLKTYPKDVRHVFKHFPLGFHPLARPGAKAILAAGEQGKYFEMLDALFALDREKLMEIRKVPKDQQIDKFGEILQDVAEDLKLDVKRFMKDYKDKDADWEKVIVQDVQSAREANVRGTPTFFINGRLTRARTLEQFKQEIDNIIAEKESQKEAKRYTNKVPRGCGG